MPKHLTILLLFFCFAYLSRITKGVRLSKTSYSNLTPSYSLIKKKKKGVRSKNILCYLTPLVEPIKS